MFGLLAGTLNGAAVGCDVVDYIVDSKTPNNTGQAIMAVDIAAFTDVQDFQAGYRRRMGSHEVISHSTGRRRNPTSWRALRNAYRQRMTEGVPLGDPLRKAVDELADRLSIQRLQ
jgi:L-2-hydroxycarboxylate dehydrogenase (NAD+)